MMKKAVFFFSAIIFTLMIIPVAHGWRLYDNFNSEVIDPAKRTIDTSSANITVENGMAKFVHTGPPNDSSWLIPKIKTQKIRGIKATVIFDSCETPNQEVRARLGANMATVRDDPNTLVWSALTMEPYYNEGNTPYIYGQLSLLDVPNTYSWIADLLWGLFDNINGITPQEVMGVPYTFIMEWTPKFVKYTVQKQRQGLGVINYTWDKSFVIEKITDPPLVFVGIGTRTDTDMGGETCTVYFDDVYVK
jgi:hypothetical protein